jgi:vacuolar-type H+-ATPase subunit E/Vma4
MTHFEGVLGYQVRTMLEGIAHDLAERSRTIEEDADRQAEQLLARTRRQCRQRGQKAVAEERALMAAAIARTEAALASRRRRRQQAIDSERLDRGLERLKQALLSRWQDAQTRRAWIDAAIDEAAAVLPPDGWVVEYGGSLDVPALTATLAGRTADPAVQASPQIECGIRIRRGSARLDMSIEGLLAHQAALAGELLAEIYALEAQTGEDDNG